MCEFLTDVYNIDIKKQFLNQIDIDKYPPRWWERIFEKSYEFEVRNNKDLYSFTANQIIEFYKFIDVKTYESLLVANINLIKYGNWALQNNLITDGQNHFNEITNETLASCINKVSIEKSIVTLEQLKEIMEQLYNKQDWYIFYALFEGIKGKNFEDIINLKITDITDGYAHLPSGDTIPVSQDFINVAMEADKETFFYDASQRIKPLQRSDTIYKPKNNSRGMNLSKAIYAAIVRNIKLAGASNYLSATSLHQSGLIHYLNKIAEEEEVSVERLLMDNQYREKVTPILNKYHFNIGVRKRFILKYNDLLK